MNLKRKGVNKEGNKEIKGGTEANETESMIPGEIFR